MSKTQKYTALTAEENTPLPELEQIHLLLEKADQIYSDLGDFISTLDALYIEKKTAHLPPSRDFLSPGIKKLSKNSHYGGHK